MSTDHSCCGGNDEQSCQDQAKTSSVNIKKICIIVSGIFAVLGFVLQFLPVPELYITGLYAVSILSGGTYVVRGAIRGLTKQRFLNIDFLVVIASLGAIYLGELPEAAAVIFFFSLAEMFEEYGVARSRRALAALVQNSPKTATLLDGSKIAVASVITGQVITVRPGELIPLDGTVSRGDSAINEASITGESIPRNKTVGDSVYAGTLNENGYLEITVSKVSTDSTLSKIISLVEQAQAVRAPTAEFIDRFSKYYTPAVVCIAILIAVLGPVITENTLSFWIAQAITLLVIACPCALVISTPVAITSAIGGASRRGILIKGGKHLEELNIPEITVRHRDARIRDNEFECVFAQYRR
jgi:Cd2+/Zn2+-exporting ATPase